MDCEEGTKGVLCIGLLVYSVATSRESCVPPQRPTIWGAQHPRRRTPPDISRDPYEYVFLGYSKSMLGVLTKMHFYFFSGGVPIGAQ